MRKIYAHRKVLSYFENAEPKIKDKLKFLLKYISNKNNLLCEPYVKHFLTAKYIRFYELRIKIKTEIVRVIFYLENEDIVLLHTFYKQDRKDTDKALKAAAGILRNNGGDYSQISIEKM